MKIPGLISFLSAMLLLFPLLTAGRQAEVRRASGLSQSPAERRRRHQIRSACSNLRQQDFTVLDNKIPRPITDFKIKSAADEPVHVIVLLDAVNIPYSMVAWSRQEVEKFLKANEGKLTYPTSIAVLTDQGVQIDNDFSTDGNALSDGLEHHPIGLREITRDSEWSDPERMQICITAFQQFLGYTSSLPGRKIVLWISPGWPLLSGPRVDLTLHQEQQIFNEIVGLSTRLQTDRSYGLRHQSHRSDRIDRTSRRLLDLS